MKSPKSSHVREKAAALLVARSLKQTGPRLGLLSILMEDHGPFTIEELHFRLRKNKMDTTDLATVYRTMARFEEQGMVVRCDFGDGAVRFELAGQDHHHHHLICQRCQKVTPLAPCHLDLTSLLPSHHGYINLTHKLEFFGICPLCVQAGVK